jgi:uncharacterized protein involved in exopolysaccharide biosynthesis
MKKSNPSEPPERTPFETLIHYAALFWKYKWLIIGLTVISAICVVIYSIVSLRLPPEKSPLPNYYTSTASLMVQDETGNMTMASMLSALGISSPTGGGEQNYGQIAMTILQSRPFLDQISDTFSIPEKYNIENAVKTNSRELLRAKSAFNYEGSTGILKISFDDIDPVFAKEVVDAMVILLDEWFRSRGGSSKMRELKSLEQKLIGVEQDIAALEQKILRFQQQHGVLNVETIAATQNALLSDLRIQLMEKELEIKNYAEISKIENDPVMLRMEAERNNIVETINQIRSGYTGDNQMMPPQDELPELSLELSKLRAELEIQNRIFQALSEQYEITKLSVEEEPVFTVLEEAEVPEEKTGPSRGKISMIVTVLAFIASMAIVMIIHLIDGIRKDPEKKKLLNKEFS